MLPAQTQPTSPAWLDPVVHLPESCALASLPFLKRAYFLMLPNLLNFWLTQPLLCCSHLPLIYSLRLPASITSSRNTCLNPPSPTPAVCPWNRLLSFITAPIMSTVVVPAGPSDVSQLASPQAEKQFLFHFCAPSA